MLLKIATKGDNSNCWLKQKGGMTAVILGGGISGLSSAYYLVRNGNPFKRVSYMFVLKSKYILMVLYMSNYTYYLHLNNRWTVWKNYPATLHLHRYLCHLNDPSTTFSSLFNKGRGNNCSIARKMCMCDI